MKAGGYSMGKDSNRETDKVAKYQSSHNIESTFSGKIYIRLVTPRKELSKRNDQFFNR